MPQCREGETVLSNLALSCPGCNLSKAGRTIGYDRQGRSTEIFNPCEYEPSQLGWHLHFSLDRETGVIAARSSVGEATIDVLNINAPNRVFARKLQVEAGSDQLIVTQILLGSVLRALANPSRRWTRRVHRRLRSLRSLRSTTNGFARRLVMRAVCCRLTSCHRRVSIGGIHDRRLRLRLFAARSAYARSFPDSSSSRRGCAALAPCWAVALHIAHGHCFGESNEFPRRGQLFASVTSFAPVFRRPPSRRPP